MACFENQASTLALLLDAGASINARAEAGATLLMAAAFGSSANCLPMLLAREGPALELDAQTNGGVTALHCTVFWGTPDCLGMLLAAVFVRGGITDPGADDKPDVTLGGGERPSAADWIADWKAKQRV